MVYDLKDEKLDVLKWIEGWYAANCDGEWEHHEGISIRTIDNPGWRISINLDGTPMEGRDFSMKIERSDQDWLVCWLAGSSFEAV